MHSGNSFGAPARSTFRIWFFVPPKQHLYIGIMLHCDVVCMAQSTLGGRRHSPFFLLPLSLCVCRRCPRHRRRRHECMQFIRLLCPRTHDGVESITEKLNKIRFFQPCTRSTQHILCVCVCVMYTKSASAMPKILDIMRGPAAQHPCGAAPPRPGAHSLCSYAALPCPRPRIRVCQAKIVFILCAAWWGGGCKCTPACRQIGASWSRGATFAHR